jgi:hypothetical protein
MTTTAWVMMITTMGIIATFTGYFFWKVLRTPHKSESDK